MLLGHFCDFCNFCGFQFFRGSNNVDATCRKGHPVALMHAAYIASTTQQGAPSGTQWHPRRKQHEPDGCPKLPSSLQCAVCFPLPLFYGATLRSHDKHGTTLKHSNILDSHAERGFLPHSTQSVKRHSTSPRRLDCDLCSASLKTFVGLGASHKTLPPPLSPPFAPVDLPAQPRGLPIR